MTGRERLLAAARGGEVDQQPKIGWDGDVDGLIVPATKVKDYVGQDFAVLAEVLNPFGQAQRAEDDLDDLLANNPEAGDARLDLWAQGVRIQMDDALAAGADGIFYRIRGAEPELCSPMHFGGHYLERDREILEGVRDALLNVIYVDAGEGAYIDFVSDLPAAIFAWSAERSSVPVEAVREMRTGALAADSPEADVTLIAMQTTAEQATEARVG
jgi:hypothetical protein